MKMTKCLNKFNVFIFISVNSKCSALNHSILHITYYILVTSQHDTSRTRQFTDVNKKSHVKYYIQFWTFIQRTHLQTCFTKLNKQLDPNLIRTHPAIYTYINTLKNTILMKESFIL